MQSEGFLQTMKTTSFSGLGRSQSLVLSYQGPPYAELCDASVLNILCDVLTAADSQTNVVFSLIPGKSCTHDTLTVGIGKVLLRAGCNLKDFCRQ